MYVHKFKKFSKTFEDKSANSFGDMNLFTWCNRLRTFNAFFRDPVFRVGE